MRHILVLGWMMASSLMMAQTVDYFPYEESFESESTLWTGVVPTAQPCITGDNPFVRHMGATTEPGTGPSTAADGSYYVYVDLSYLSCRNKQFALTSPLLDFSFQESGSLSFKYHMNGADIGSLSVELSTDGGSTWPTSLFSVAGDQGTSWSTQNIDLSGYLGNDVKIRFVGTSTNTGSQGHIAIDDISITTTPLEVDVVYTYDEAGNRTARTYQVSPMGNMAANTMASVRSDVSTDTDQIQDSGIDISQFKVYPNPTANYISIERRGEMYQKSLQYTIRNQSGQQVYQSNSAQPVSRIDMSALPSGMYILTVVDGESAPVSWRIMKN